MSKMDGFTAAALLSAVEKGMDNDKVADLYKMFKGEESNGPSQEARDWITKNKGKRVKSSSGNVGVVERLNDSTCGVYNGERYPIYVRHDEDGKIYEYGLDELEVLEA